MQLVCLVFQATRETPNCRVLSFSSRTTGKKNTKSRKRSALGTGATPAQLETFSNPCGQNGLRSGPSWNVAFQVADWLLGEHEIYDNLQDHVEALIYMQKNGRQRTEMKRTMPSVNVYSSTGNAKK
jgi:hypothetical protein